MTYPITFANLAAGNQPLSDFDTMFLQVAAMLAIPSTAVGANAIVATPVTNCPSLAAYTPLCSFQFLAAANSTGAVTFQQTGLAALPVYRADGTTQITSGDLVAGHLYSVVYSAALNGGSGGFYLVTATLSPTIQVTGGSFSGLSVSNNVTTPDTKIDVTAAEIVMVNPSNGSGINVQAPAFTIDTTTVGANGMDSGTLQAQNWYYVWAISNGVTTAGLFSLNSTAPTMPGGYTFRKRLGAMRTDLPNGQTSTVTISQASPGVVTWNASNLTNNTPVVFTTTGGLPAPLTVGQTYYVQNASANTFNVSAGPFGTPINTTSAGSGTHTATLPNARVMRTIQRERRVQYQVVAPPASTIYWPIVANGVAGTSALVSPTLVAVPLGAFVPPTASRACIAVYSNWFNTAASIVLVAPSTTWSGTQQGPEGTNAYVWPFVINRTGNIEPNSAQYGDIIPETGNQIAWASSGAGGAIAIAGWVDNL